MLEWLTSVLSRITDGSLLPAAWSWVHSWRYAKDPWAAGALDVDPDGEVLLLGTGLTMLDIAIALKEHGHRGVIHAVSRRGLLPQPHRVSIRPPTPLRRSICQA